jgi:hypothetical protein
LDAFESIKSLSFGKRESPTPPLRAAETNSGSGSTGIITTIVSIIAVVILARACGSNFGRDLAEKRIAEREEKNTYSESPTDIVEDSLGQLVRLASAGLPKMVDSITRFDSVTLQNGNTVIETYTITTLTKNELDVSGLTFDLNLKIKSEFRSDPKTKILRDNNVVWVRKYYDKNRELIITVSSAT